MTTLSLHEEWQLPFQTSTQMRKGHFHSGFRIELQQKSACESFLLAQETGSSRWKMSFNRQEWHFFRLQALLGKCQVVYKLNFKHQLNQFLMIIKKWQILIGNYSYFILFWNTSQMSSRFALSSPGNSNDLLSKISLCIFASPYQKKILWVLIVGWLMGDFVWLWKTQWMVRWPMERIRAVLLETGEFGSQKSRIFHYYVNQTVLIEDSSKTALSHKQASSDNIQLLR